MKTIARPSSSARSITFVVAHRSARLDDDGNAGLGRRLDAVGERVERVAAHAPPSARPAAFFAAISPDSTRFC